MTGTARAPPSSLPASGIAFYKKKKKKKPTSNRLFKSRKSNSFCNGACNKKGACKACTKPKRKKAAPKAEWDTAARERGSLFALNCSWGGKKGLKD